MSEPTAAAAATWIVIEGVNPSPLRSVDDGVRFHLYSDTLHDGYVTYRGLTLGYLEDWGSEGCLFVPCITRVEDEHPRPLDADDMTALYELVCGEVSLALRRLDAEADNIHMNRKVG